MPRPAITSLHFTATDDGDGTGPAADDDADAADRGAQRQPRSGLAGDRRPAVEKGEVLAAAGDGDRRRRRPDRRHRHGHAQRAAAAARPGRCSTSAPPATARASCASRRSTATAATTSSRSPPPTTATAAARATCSRRAQTFVVKVAVAAEPPLLAPIGTKVAVIGQPLQFTLRASDLDQDPLHLHRGRTCRHGATLVAGAAYGTAVFTLDARRPPTPAPAA